MLLLARNASIVLLALFALVVHAAIPTTNINGTDFPNFSKLKASDIETTLDEGIKNYNNRLNTILQKPASWDNTIAPLEEGNTHVRKYWNLLRHLNSVAQTPEIRAVYNKALPKMVNFRADLMHNTDIYEAYKIIKQGPEFEKLNKQQQVVIDLMLLEFQLAGAKLSPQQKIRYREIVQKLSKLSNEFRNNYRDALESWQYHIPPDSADMLDGIPEFAIEDAAKHAKESGKEGWILTLEPNTMNIVQTYAKSRELRKILFTANAAVASDKDPDPLRHQWDNGGIVTQILALRQELATILGFDNYAEFSLADNEAPSTQAVMQFLEDLAVKARPAARSELDRLEAFAMSAGSIETLEPWDMYYYADWLKHAKFGVSREEIRKYLPTTQVLNGLFSLSSILFNLHIAEVPNAITWDPKVKLYSVNDNSDKPIGYFYLDLYTRGQKSPGDWTAEYTSRLLYSDDSIQLPISIIVNNFKYSDPSLLDHRDVVTLFHEFGHMLQNVATQSNYPSISGVNGIAWDAVEFASKFMENWAWQQQVLQDIAQNIDNKQDLPKEIVSKLISAKNFNSGLHMLAIMEMSIFDMRLHLNLPQDEGKSPTQILQEVRNQFRIAPALDQDILANRFTHIFAGGYAAGFYGYTWAEVLSADSYAAFAEQGYFSARIGKKFLNTFLAKGGQDSTLDLFVEFRGRKPEIKYLLEQKAIQH